VPKSGNPEISDVVLDLRDSTLNIPRGHEKYYDVPAQALCT
jgi:hypothetical protein